VIDCNHKHANIIVFVTVRISQYIAIPC